MPISAKWKHKSSIHIGFIVFNGGVTTFFAKSVTKQEFPVYLERVEFTSIYNGSKKYLVYKKLLIISEET